MVAAGWFTPETEWLRWVAIAVLVAAIYFIVVIKLWNWFLSLRGMTTEEEAKYRAEEDADQLAYLQKWYASHRERPLFTEADKTLFKLLKSMVPDEGEGPKLLMIDHPNLAKAYQVRPGGFVMVKGPYEVVETYFRFRRWELLPFLYRDRRIYRKPR
jgi:hypothetical protein